MLTVGWSPLYNHPVGEQHRFPMEKYDLVLEQLLHEGVIDESQVFAPNKLSNETIELTHDASYLQKLITHQLTPKEERKTGFKHSRRLVDREITIMDGTIRSALYALKNGCSFNIAGGTHHAYADHGEGFCLLNDFAIASNYLLNKKRVKKVAILDLDVHQGNGTAKIFENNPHVFTLSIHGTHNYPLHKERSSLDIELPDDCKDLEYLQAVEEGMRAILAFQPDLVFYQCGVDILATDKLGRMSVSAAGCKQRDELVFNQLMAAEIPVCASLGGGYSERIGHIVDAHVNTFKAAIDAYF